MNAKKFSDALSALDGRYVEEAARYRRKHGQSFWAVSYTHLTLPTSDLV